MITVDVVLPTYQREEMLRRTLTSIHSAIELCRDKVEVKVFYSLEEEWKKAKEEMQYSWLWHEMLPSLHDDFRAINFWNWYLKQMGSDALVYLTDDILLDRFCLLIAIEEIKKMDLDGVVGFHIDNRTEERQPCLAAFGVVGKKFAERFPDRAVFCPDYYSLFADLELQAYAESVGRFKFQSACRLVHYHPSYTNEVPDATHLHTRRRVSRESGIYLEREKAGLLWGESFKLINQGGSNV